MNYKHLLMALFLLMLSHSSNAALYLVNTADDFPDNDLMDGVCDTGLSGQEAICSLRAAVMEANASQGVEDTIVLPNNIGNYRLSRVDEDDDAFKGDLDITDDVAVINGTQAGATIDADFNDRAFHVHTNARLTLEGINIVNGLANTPNTYQGGAVFVDGGELVAERVTFKNNVANQGGAINGVDAFVSLDQAYFHHNATSEEPNLSRGSAFYIEGSEVMIGNTTVAHNINPSSNPQVVSIVPESSAIFAVGNTSDVLIYNSTVAQNHNGISFSSGNQLNIIHTTIANNAAYGMRVISAENLLIERSLYAQNDINCLIGAISMNTTLEYNGSTDSSCNFTGVTHIENMPDSLHGALNDWGGYAPTLMLYKNSEAIDAVTGCDTDFLVDQRGADRPVDGNDDNLAFCDMGAIEFNPQTDDDVIFRNGFD